MPGRASGKALHGATTNGGKAPRGAATSGGRRNREEGVALIVALVIVVLLTVIIFEFSYDTQVEASFAANTGDDFEAYLAAKSAVAQALGVLTQDVVDQLFPPQAQPGQQQNLQPTGPFDSIMESWYTEGVPFGQINNAAMRATISDEYGKINLNALFDNRARLENPEAEPVPNEAVVQTLLHFFAVYDPEIEPTPEELVAAIMDWIDPDDDYSDYVGAEGAESDFYEESEIPYPCKNGPMDAIEELLLIRGFRPELFFGDPEKGQLPLTEYLTVHGEPGGAININTAHPFVLDAVGVALGESGQVQIQGNFRESVMSVRFAEGGFVDVSDLEANQIILPPAANEQQPRNEENIERQEMLYRYFRVSSDVFRIRGDAIAGETKVRILAYVYRNPSFFTGDPGGQPPAQVEGASPEGLGLPVPEEPYRILEWKVIR